MWHQVIKPKNLNCVTPCFTYRATLNHKFKFQTCHLGNHIWLDPDFKLTFVPSVKLWPWGLWIHTCQNNIYHLNCCCSVSAVLVSLHPSRLPSSLLSSLHLHVTSIFILPSSYIPLSFPKLQWQILEFKCLFIYDITLILFYSFYPKNLLLVWRNVS